MLWKSESGFITSANEGLLWGQNKVWILYGKLSWRMNTVKKNAILGIPHGLVKKFKNCLIKWIASGGLKVQQPMKQLNFIFIIVSSVRENIMSRFPTNIYWHTVECLYFIATANTKKKTQPIIREKIFADVYQTTHAIQQLNNLILTMGSASKQIFWYQVVLVHWNLTQNNVQ